MKDENIFTVGDDPCISSVVSVVSFFFFFGVGACAGIIGCCDNQSLFGCSNW